MRPGAGVEAGARNQPGFPSTMQFITHGGTFGVISFITGDSPSPPPPPLFKPVLRKFFVIRRALALAAFPLCSPLGWEQLRGCPPRTLDAAKPGVSLSVNDICGTGAVTCPQGGGRCGREPAVACRDSWPPSV